MAGTYRTPGRERLMKFLEAHPDTPYTVDELAAALHTEASASSAPTDKQIPRIGKSSLYRQLAELVADGTVRRDREAHDTRDMSTSDSRAAAAVYRYVARPDCARHFHLQCVCCGRLLHLDCALTKDLLSHIQSDHHFLVNMGKSILYGQCEDCAKRNGENEGHEEHGGYAKEDFFEKKSSLDSPKKHH